MNKVVRIGADKLMKSAVYLHSISGEQTVLRAYERRAAAYWQAGVPRAGNEEQHNLFSFPIQHAEAGGTLTPQT